MEIKEMLSKEVKSILQEADRKILSLAFGNHHLLYQLVRITISRIAHVDSFYVGYYYPQQEMVFPYSFDGQEYDDPESFQYSNDGLSAWMLKNKQPYQYTQDNGFLLNKGKSYGNESELSKDAVAVPLLERFGEHQTQVLGIVSVQSYKEKVYNNSSVCALQWLADAMATALLRERDDELRRRKLDDGEVSHLKPKTIVSFVEEIGGRLKAMRNKIACVEKLADKANDELISAVEDLRLECEESQTQTIELLLRAITVQDSVLPNLTTRQREILSLLVEERSTKEIAKKLSISENTVKSHVTAITTQFGVKGRSGVVEITKRILY